MPFIEDDSDGGESIAVLAETMAALMRGLVTSARLQTLFPPMTPEEARKFNMIFSGMLEVMEDWIDGVDEEPQTQSPSLTLEECDKFTMVFSCITQANEDMIEEEMAEEA